MQGTELLRRLCSRHGAVIFKTQTKYTAFLEKRRGVRGEEYPEADVRLFSREKKFFPSPRERSPLIGNDAVDFLLLMCYIIAPEESNDDKTYKVWHISCDALARCRVGSIQQFVPFGLVPDGFYFPDNGNHCPFFFYRNFIPAGRKGCDAGETGVRPGHTDRRSASQ